MKNIQDIEKRQKRIEHEKQAELREAKKRAIKIAKELGYLELFPDLKTKINNATSPDKISMLMCFCRKAY